MLGTEKELLGVVVEAKSKLGIGLYTPNEAARLARATTQSAIRWLFGNKQGDAVFVSRFANSDERLVSFLDLVQLVAVRNARRLRPAIPLQKIREGVQEAEAQYRVSNILARWHLFYWFDGRVILRLPDERLVCVDHSREKHQQMMAPIVEPFLYELDFSEDGLAREWSPLSYGNCSVSLNPRFKFGQPVIKESGILVDALARSAKSEGSPEAAARVHGVPVEQVILAIKYDDHLSGLAA